jgi:F-type H+-transporting ATPase subunit epsilon
VYLVAPDGEVWFGDAVSITAPGASGRLGILPGHVPIACLLTNGPVRIRPTAGEPVEIQVSGGFLFVADGTVTVLADAVG